MTPDEYLQKILIREAVNTGPTSPLRNVLVTLQPIISAWANQYLANIGPSGSFAKGTANHSGTDIDLFISLLDSTPDTLKQIYDSLAKRLKDSGYTPRRQNVSINVKVSGYSVDLVPGKRQDAYGSDHSLYRSKANTWTKTNVAKHVSYVQSGGRIDEIRILKLWRDQKGIEFPSFYLEMTVINALSGQYIGTLAGRVWKVFEYLRDTFPSARVVDPANTNNVISDDLTVVGKARIKAVAEQALKATDWSQIVT